MAEKTPARIDAAALTVRFEATVRTIGGRLILRLPDDASAKLPSRGQVAVKAVMNGHAFQTVIEPDGMRGHWLDVDEKTSRALSVSGGDTVALGIEPTKDWPEPEIPEDFQAALAGAPDICKVWQGITAMSRWEWVRWINATRNPQTRSRRVEVGISKLRSGKRRPCCFDLASCTDPDLSRNGKLAAAV
ncbi:DUF1905 domain-containing protein [Paeniglutamicibacter antarcticus]|uniref:DUF1905 domain-containing protein n=1 Tax=Arthrobacter terrae TaxID=2935737 RepID=A0A931CIQ0_9MICC|nr:YdeI/OmpD-associated family protein [Arthrobacter terrae]MBG0739327.1 DUF1905 domain-containing protein [Arthrobacter terrae]